MKFSNLFFSLLVTVLSLNIAVQKTAHAKNVQGYISDTIPTFVHSGPGKNYRILGTINSGSEVKITGKSQNDYAEVINDKGRTVWLESKYVTKKPGLRVVIAQLNSKLADLEGNSSEVSERLMRANKNVNRLSTEKIQLNNEISTLNKTLSELKLKIKDQDTNIKKEWFFNGAIVLCIGLVLGLVIPRLSSNKKSSMSNWG
jgi:SH3 domain protein